MKRKELEQLENRAFVGDTPLLDEIYVVIDRKKHYSGYKLLNIYGIARDDNDYHNILYKKQLSACSDAIHFKFDIKTLNRLNYGMIFSMDSTECNVTRYFIHDHKYRFKVGLSLSDFDITIVEVE